MHPPEWITALLPRLTDGELVALADAVLEEMSTRAAVAEESGH